MGGYGLLNHYIVLFSFPHPIEWLNVLLLCDRQCNCQTSKEKAEICNYAYCSHWHGLQNCFFFCQKIFCIFSVSKYLVSNLSHCQRWCSKVFFFVFFWEGGGVGIFNSAKVVHISLPWFKLCPKMQQVKWLLTVYK